MALLNIFCVYVTVFSRDKKKIFDYPRLLWIKFILEIQDFMKTSFFLHFFLFENISRAQDA